MAKTPNLRSPLPLASTLAKAEKAHQGRTTAKKTPLVLRLHHTRVNAATREWMSDRLGRQLGKFALHIQNVEVRCTDVNSKKGGIDKACQIKVLLNGLPVVVVEEMGELVREAFDRAAAVAERAVRRSLERSEKRTPRPRGKVASTVRTTKHEAAPKKVKVSNPQGSLLGKRVGRTDVQLKEVAARPEKKRRDFPVDTSLPGISASHRKVGARGTATRNTKLNKAGFTTALEDSAKDRPSRKSTRTSANRALPDSNLRRRATRRTRSPQARATRAAVQR